MNKGIIAIYLLDKSLPRYTVRYTRCIHHHPAYIRPFHGFLVFNVVKNECNANAYMFCLMPE